MQLANTRIVPAPPETVFRALNDPEVLKACVPGCESLTRLGGDAFEARMMARIGPVSAKFSGRMTLADVDPPHGYTLRFDGQGGAAGFARGEARVRLTPAEGGQTSMHYDVDAQVGGKLAQIGSRLVDAAAKKIADDFFRNFNEKVAALQGDPETTVVLPKPGEQDHPAAEPGDKQMPGISNTTLAFFAAGALLVVLASLITLLG
jgi:carbon monoxide dehydrogenase subunit G